MKIEKTYTKDELKLIENFVINKFKVVDVYKLKDKFEGEQYLFNTIRKVYVLWTLLEIIKIENYKNIKPGFLSSVDIFEFTKLNLILHTSKRDVIELENSDTETIIAFVDIERRKAIIIIDEENFDRTKKQIEQYLSNIKGNVFI
jgi:hypothetical protein